MHQITCDELNFGPLNITTDLMERYRYIRTYSQRFRFFEGTIGGRKGGVRKFLKYLCINISWNKMGYIKLPV